MAIVNDAGEPVCTLRQLVKRLEKVTKENDKLRESLEALSADMMSQGGVILDGLAFTLWHRSGKW